MAFNPHTCALAFLFLCVSLAPQARAQEGAPGELLPASDVERLELNPGRGSLLVGGGELLQQGTFRVALAVHYQRTPLRMNMGEKRLELIGHRGMTLVTGALGVLPWLEVDLQLPVVLMQTGDSLSSQGLQSPASRGLGTPVARARMGVLSQRAGDALDLLVDLGLGLPLGNAQVLAREPLPRLHSNVLLGRRVGRVRINLDGGLLLRIPGRLGPAAFTNSRQGQELRLGATLGTAGDGVRFETTLRTALALENGHNSTEFFGGARYPLYSWLEVFGLAGVGLGSLPGTPSFRILAGVAAGEPPPPINASSRRAVSGQDDLVGPSEKRQPPQLMTPPTDSNDVP